MVGAVGVGGAIADLAEALRADADKAAIDRLPETCDAAISQFAALDAGCR